jgi:hypothetical protein
MPALVKRLPTALHGHVTACADATSVPCFEAMTTGWDRASLATLARNFGGDAGGDVLPGHGVGDDDEVVGDAGRDALGPGEEGVGGGALERAEGRAVDGVEDDRDAGLPGGKPSEDAGLARVGVDDVRPVPTEGADEVAVSEPVGPGTDRSDEVWEEGQCARVFVEQVFQGAFSAGGGAGQEAYVEVRALPEAEDRGDRVFLGATDDQARDDVVDAPAAGGVRLGHGAALRAATRAVRLE